MKGSKHQWKKLESLKCQIHVLMRLDLKWEAKSSVHKISTKTEHVYNNICLLEGLS